MFFHPDLSLGTLYDVFVTFEGPEGAGKSTAIRQIAEQLRAEGHQVTVTREPGSGEVGAAIRQILLHGEALEPRAELFLFLADRAQHVATVIRPALAQGHIVLCDRHADSTLVYQGYGRGLDLEQLRAWNAFATNGLKPSLTLLFDLDIKLGLSRLQNPDRLDDEPISFHEEIRRGFLAEAEHDPGRWVVINAANSPTKVASDALSAIQRRLNA